MAIRKAYQILPIIYFFLILINILIVFSSSSSIPYNSKFNHEFSKDISSLAVESTLKSKCPGTIFILTSECEDHFNLVGEELSFWSNPIIIINYNKPSFLESLSSSEATMEKWSFFLQSKISQSCNFIFICDLITTTTMATTHNLNNEDSASLHHKVHMHEYIKFTHFPQPIIRSVDQVLYFYFDSSSSSSNNNKDNSRAIATQQEILKYTEILMFINKNKTQQMHHHQRYANESNSSSSSLDFGTTTLSAYSSCKYCRPISLGNSISNQLLGTWQRNKTTIAKYFTIFSFQSEYSFNNFTFNIGYLNYQPHFSCFHSNAPSTPSNNNNRDLNCTGIEWEMLNKMSQQLQFKYKLINFTLNGGHGIVVSKFNITGMLGALKNESLDVGIGGVIVTTYRNKFVDFTKIFSSESIVFVVEKHRDIYILGIFLAFQPSVWPLLIFTIICLSILFKFISNHHINFSYGLQYAIGTLLGQPLTHSAVITSPRHLMKIFLVTWWFTSLIIGIFYNTSLITSLITPVTPKEPESLNELIEQGYSFRLGSKQSVVYGILQQLETNFDNEAQIHGHNSHSHDNENYEDTDDHFLMEDEEGNSNEINVPFKLIKQKLVSNILKENNEGGGGAGLSKSKIVYVVEESNAENIDWKSLYRISRKRIIQERLFLTSYGWALREGAPFKRKFDVTIDQLVSVGLMNYWHDQNTQKENRSTTTISSKFRLQGKLGQIKMNLSILHGAFIFFLIGCLASGFVFGLELLSKRYTFRFLTIKEIKILIRKMLNLLGRLIVQHERTNNGGNKRIVGPELVKAGRNTIQLVTAFNAVPANVIPNVSSTNVRSRKNSKDANPKVNFKNAKNELTPVETCFIK